MTEVESEIARMIADSAQIQNLRKFSSHLVYIGDVTVEGSSRISQVPHNTFSNRN